MRFFGGLFIALGLLLMFYFFAVFSTSVKTDVVDNRSGTAGTENNIRYKEFNNLGLMGDRICGVLVGGFLTVSGCALMGGKPPTVYHTVYGFRRRKPRSTWE